MNEIQPVVTEVTTKATEFANQVQEAATVLVTDTSWVEVIATGIVLGLGG